MIVRVSVGLVLTVVAFAVAGAAAPVTTTRTSGSVRADRGAAAAYRPRLLPMMSFMISVVPP
jgi:hypothetical protein